MMEFEFGDYDVGIAQVLIFAKCRVPHFQLLMEKEQGAME